MESFYLPLDVHFSQISSLSDISLCRLYCTNYLVPAVTPDKLMIPQPTQTALKSVRLKVGQSQLRTKRAKKTEVT